MPRYSLAALAIAGLAMAMPQSAHAQDGVFGNLLSGFTRFSDAKSTDLSEAQLRDREARSLRRDYWERERQRLARDTLARDASNQTIATR
ncbi:hypothetical protein [Roseomonas xinghualingensis]|uniref:hypothetical protein n=1 Tax=Roseomonas xinghualingensis TaxID=2986475 RepID=UPI0021F143A1|nr:hypothetical protein [Roseomonas sp. SXEYE001]MCV4208121.1 hypothetical protein [Roseomonas sp. SXEYE001]